LGDLDPCWAILSEPGTRYGGWDLAKFFATGQAEIAAVMTLADRFALPKERHWALDFGCGIGRLTNALASRFGRVVGIDISESMIRRAAGLNQRVNCDFLVNTSESLPFGSARFDFIYTAIVLQHILRQETIRQYISEFVRVLKPGGLIVMQLPSHIPLRRRIQLRRRVYSWLRAAGISERLLYNRFRLHPIPMNFLPEHEVTSILVLSGARILEARPDQRAGPHILSRTYFATKETGMCP
jgi:SAM-dependent methyltransferase